MTFPPFEYCIVCEGLRPELGSKVQILGFYGLAPNVEIWTLRLDQALAVSFLIGFAPFSGLSPQVLEYSMTLTGPSGQPLIEFPTSLLNVEQNKRIILAIGGSVIPSEAGVHGLRVRIDNEVVLDTSFVLRLATGNQRRTAGLLQIQ